MRMDDGSGAVGGLFVVAILLVIIGMPILQLYSYNHYTTEQREVICVAKTIQVPEYYNAKGKLVSYIPHWYVYFDFDRLNGEKLAHVVGGNHRCFVGNVQEESWTYLFELRYKGGNWIPLESLNDTENLSLVLIGQK